jgi:putative membrane protein PagO
VTIRLKTKVVIWLIVVCLIWGSTWLVIKLGLATMPPLLAAGLRFLLASLILLGMLVIRKEELPRGKAFRMLVVVM